jgi:hypothetical protein
MGAEAENKPAKNKKAPAIRPKMSKSKSHKKRMMVLSPS